SSVARCGVLVAGSVVGGNGSGDGRERKACGGRISISGERRAGHRRRRRAPGPTAGACRRACCRPRPVSAAVAVFNRNPASPSPVARNSPLEHSTDASEEQRTESLRKGSRHAQDARVSERRCPQSLQPRGERTKKIPTDQGWDFGIGGGGGSRTRVRRRLTPSTTCLAHCSISSSGSTACETRRSTSLKNFALH